MIVDCDRHAEVAQYPDLFEHMTLDWRKHFEREEWVGSVNLGSTHIRVTERFVHDPPPPYEPPSGGLTLVLPHQGLTVNGWADRVAAKPFLEAINSYAEVHWAAPRSKLAVLVSPHDVRWSAAEVRRRAESGSAGAVALPLVPEMLGSRTWDPIYEACCENGLPLVIHYSGVEGRYLGAAPLSGGVHASAFARLSLMPHLAESNIASLTFEGAFARFPDLQVVFAGFGFTWLPSLLWRIDREWRTFRHDVPWVTAPPSQQVMSNMWFTSYPLGEAKETTEWEKGFTAALRERIVFGSHAPYGADLPADVERVLGGDWGQQMQANGARLLGWTGVAVS
jgi:predicted TIM-barrel fold metal-dependent hydrolase